MIVSAALHSLAHGRCPPCRCSFNLFLAIIVGMLAGLILLSLNLELPLLGLAQKVTISWWERAAISGILWSNLSAGHRTRNRECWEDGSAAVVTAPVCSTPCRRCCCC